MERIEQLEEAVMGVICEDVMNNAGGSTGEFQTLKDYCGDKVYQRWFYWNGKPEDWEYVKRRNVSDILIALPQDLFRDKENYGNDKYKDFFRRLINIEWSNEDVAQRGGVYRIIGVLYNDDQAINNTTFVKEYKLIFDTTQKITQEILGILNSENPDINTFIQKNEEWLNAIRRFDAYVKDLYYDVQDFKGRDYNSGFALRFMFNLLKIMTRRMIWINEIIDTAKQYGNQIPKNISLSDPK